MNQINKINKYQLSKQMHQINAHMDFHLVLSSACNTLK